MLDWYHFETANGCVEKGRNSMFQGLLTWYNWPHQQWRLNIVAHWTLNKRNWKESIHPKCKQACVQFWKIVYCWCITVFFTIFKNLVNPDWKYFHNITSSCKTCHFTPPCMGPSYFADASCHWLKCIWLLSPRLSSWVLGISCLNQGTSGVWCIPACPAFRSNRKFAKTSAQT